MGRFLRRHPEYLMAAFVMVLVVGLALARSAGVAITVGPEAPTLVSATPEDDWPWFEAGMELWDARCYGCHAEVTYLPDLFLAEGGRSYLIELMLFGLPQSEVVIEGELRTIRHPPFASIDDEQLAAVLNMMLVAWGNDEALPDEVEFFTPEEFAEARTPELTRDEVLERRPNPWE
jgi:hypothetical protein